MSDIRTTFMGINLANPILVGASPLTADMATLHRIEEAGAGGLVTMTLFEEEIGLEELEFDESLHKYDSLQAEMIMPMPHIRHAGPREHLMWVRKAKQELGLPVIGSVNAVQEDTWLDYARRMADTGVDGLECNLYAAPRDFGKTGAEVEQEQIDLIAKVVQAVSIPVSVKLSPYYANLLNIVRQMDQAGASGFVLFNRPIEPDIDLGKKVLYSPSNFSPEGAHRLPLRYAGLLEGNIRGSLCCSGGFLQGEHVAKAILAGADAVQVVTAIYEKGIRHLRALADSLQAWMAKQGYASLKECRGLMSGRHVVNPGTYMHGQYVTKQIHPKVEPAHQPHP